MNRYEEDDIDALGHLALVGATAFLCTAVVLFMVWAGWLV